MRNIACGDEIINRMVNRMVRITLISGGKQTAASPFEKILDKIITRHILQFV